jgi:hypothetical protein
MQHFILWFLIFAGVSTQARASEIKPADFGRVVDAIYKIEGGARAKKPFGILSVPCNDYAACRKICANTVRNNYKRWERAGRPGSYLKFLADRYCPVGAENDPRNLNRNWLGNLRAVLKGK